MWWGCITGPGEVRVIAVKHAGQFVAIGIADIGGIEAGFVV